MVQLRKGLQFLLTCILLLGLLGLAPAGGQAAEVKVQPRLGQLARKSPETGVVVIAQFSGEPGQARALVEALGGRITKELSIIRAIAAEMTAGAALRLSRNAAVRWVSLDGPVERSGRPTPTHSLVEPSQPANTYLQTLGVAALRATTAGANLKGKGVTVAVIDSGIALDPDFTGTKNISRILRQESFSTNSRTVNDTSGHGTHVAGIIAGNGLYSQGLYAGIAPQANLLSLKISDETGMAYESDTVEAMQWVLDNKNAYNIRVVNLSINATVEQSYHTSPLDAAAEILWFNGIVVVASAGNSTGAANTIQMAPANDPFIITVGASSEKSTPERADDILAPFSAFGTTTDGFSKPEIIAPGSNIISVLSKSSSWDTQFPDRRVMGSEYFRISGTSMAAPMVAGAAALLLQQEPGLTPDQVKHRLIATAAPLALDGGAPYLDVYAALTSSTTESANTGIPASQMLSTGPEPVVWNSVNWNSVNWNSVNWNSVNWNSVNWNSVNWNSVNWEN